MHHYKRLPGKTGLASRSNEESRCQNLGLDLACARHFRLQLALNAAIYLLTCTKLRLSTIRRSYAHKKRTRTGIGGRQGALSQTRLPLVLLHKPDQLELSHVTFSR